MRLRSILTALALASCGCVGHTARVLRPGPQPAMAVVGVGAAKLLPPVTVVHRAQPLDLPVSAWYRGQNGPLLRYEGRVRTPLAWWQRFPADLVSDLLLPWPFDATAEVTVVWRGVPETEPAALEAAAARAGYAHRGAPGPSKPR